MRLIATTAFITTAALFSVTDSFGPVLTKRRASQHFRPYPSSSLIATFATQESKETTTSPCDVDASNEKNVASVTALSLRSASLLNIRGQRVRLGDVMAEGTSIVVFLRHMGWPYCWSYAKDWCELQEKEDIGDIVGPLFVSIGDEEKLRIFLEKNPHIPTEQAFVEDDMKNFSAYTAAGFGRFDEQDPNIVKQVKMSAPNGINWWNYASSVPKLSPIPKDLKFGEVPEGVLRLGGTFVVRGDEILYKWSDRLPGDHPDIQEVLRIARQD
jgi:hypothetical protein